jgi:hypothetical protein
LVLCSPSPPLFLFYVTRHPSLLLYTTKPTPTDSSSQLVVTFGFFIYIYTNKHTYILDTYIQIQRKINKMHVFLYMCVRIHEYLVSSVRFVDVYNSTSLMRGGSSHGG